jgi:zinc protease
MSLSGGPGIEKWVFPGGLSLVTRRDEAEPLASVRVYVRGGSIAEWPAGGRGVAHLLEHVAATEAAGAMNRGGRAALLRAFTARDHTGFAWSVLPEDCAPSLALFFAAIDALRRDPERLERRLRSERGVVREEIALFQERGVPAFQQHFLEELFEVHPVRHPVCGRLPRVEAASGEELGDYLDRIYVAPHLTVALAGGFDTEEVVGAFAEIGGRIARGPVFALGPETAEPARSALRLFTAERDGLREAWTLLGFRTPGSPSADRAPLAALAGAIGENREAGLRHALLDSGLAREVDARSATTAFGVGYFEILARHRPEDTGAVAEALLAWLDGVKRDGPSLDGLDGAGTAWRTADAWAAALGESDLRTGDPREEATISARPDPGRIAAAVARSAGPDSLTLGQLLPCPPAGRLRRGPFRVEERTAVLPNGARLLVLPTGSPQAACHVMVRGGLLLEPAAGSGLSTLTASLLPESLGEEDARELRGWRNRTGSRILPFSDESFTGLTLLANGEDLLAGLPLLAGMALRPVFRPDEVERQLQATLKWLEHPARPWWREAQIGLRRVLYPRHPYGRLEEGTPDTLRALPRDVEACHRRLFVPERMVVAVAGAVPAEAVLERLTGLFGDLTAGASGADLPEPEIPHGPAEERIELIRPRAALGVGFSGIPFEPGTWAALEVLRTLLGGAEGSPITGRLPRAVRELGAAYQVQVLLQSGAGEGYLALLAEHAPASMERVLASLLGEIERVRQEGVPPEELETCRKLSAIAHRLTLGNARLLAYSAGRRALLAGTSGEHERSADALRSVPAGDVEAAAHRFFREEARGIVRLLPRSEAPGDSP